MNPHAEFAAFGSHAENAESAESESHAESAEFFSLPPSERGVARSAGGEYSEQRRSRTGCRHATHGIPSLTMVFQARHHAKGTGRHWSEFGQEMEGIC